MRKCLLAAALITTSLCVGQTAVHAGTVIPYQTPGVQNSETYNFVATATGNITGYLYSAFAADLDSIALSVNGGPLTSFGLVNTSSVGTTFNFDNISVNAGDKLTFILLNSTNGTQISSIPGSNSDLAQHVYSVNYTNPGLFAVTGIPTGTFVSFEDLLASQGSDFDYNDDSFVFTNVGVVPLDGTTPILATLPLLTSGLGVLGLLAVRRKRRSRKIAI